MLTGLWATSLILGPLTTSGLGLVSVSGVTFSRGFQKIGNSAGAASLPETI